MSWARPPGSPEIPATPLELLEPKESDYEPLYTKYGIQFGAAIMGLVGPCVSNYYRRRPLFTGFWINIVSGIALYHLGLKVKELREEIYADKDAVMRQYIRSHPEDFPPYPRILIKDTIEPWNPRR